MQPIPVKIDDNKGQRQDSNLQFDDDDEVSLVGFSKGIGRRTQTREDGATSAKKARCK